MQKIELPGRHVVSTILAGESIGKLSSYLPDGDVWVITDENLFRHYHEHLMDMPAYVLKPGEQSKDFGSIVKICHWLMEQGADRAAFILGIGGGVVCDIAGFVASVYMRGVDFGFVATSLMAQVDAAIGGKNGVNLDGYKNIIGTFNQPRFVLCDHKMLYTLPANEIKNGLAEVVKHCLIDGRELFYKILETPKAIIELEKKILAEMVEHSVRVKTNIVKRDELEHGERRKLNLGHTWGHAVEKTDGIPHGQAVSIGLAFAAGLSEYKGMITTAERKDIVKLLQALGLPTATKTNANTIAQHILKDKKKTGDHIHFVLMNGIGNVTVERITYAELLDFATSQG